MRTGSRFVLGANLWWLAVGCSGTTTHQSGQTTDSGGLSGAGAPSAGGSGGTTATTGGTGGSVSGGRAGESGNSGGRISGGRGGASSAGGSGGRQSAGGSGAEGGSGAGGGKATGGGGTGNGGGGAGNGGSGGIGNGGTGATGYGGRFICPPCVAPPHPGCVGEGPCGCAPYNCPDAGNGSFCSDQLRRTASSPACSGTQPVLWEASSGDIGQFSPPACRSLPTNLPRFCCTEAFTPHCPG